MQKIPVDSSVSGILRYVHPAHLTGQSVVAMQAAYRSGLPFPHIIIDNFLHPEAASVLEAELDRHADGWINYYHFNERKRGFNQIQMMSPEAQSIVQELQSRPFLEHLEKLTGIDGLISDPDMDGGGFHQMKRDGFLNVHVDFLAHTLKKTWSRQINLLIYLNRDWKDEYNGQLELWDPKVTRCLTRVRPEFNRCVIFHTAKNSFHGVPEKIMCPENRSRRSLALYYFRDEGENRKISSTNYRPRPQDNKFQRLAIGADRLLLRLYSYWKRYAGVSETHLTKIMRYFFK